MVVAMRKLLNDWVAIDPDMFFCFVSNRRCSFLLFLKIIAMGWYFTFDCRLYHSYFLNSLVHLQVISVDVLGTALYWLYFLEVVLFEVVHAVC